MKFKYANKYYLPIPIINNVIMYICFFLCFFISYANIEL